MSVTQPLSGPRPVEDLPVNTAASPSTNPVSTPKKDRPKPRPIKKAKTAASPAKSGVKPTRTLPTERINIAKQLDILRAYAAASANGSKAATINEVGQIVKMAASTVSMTNAFFASVGLLQRTDAGTYFPSAEVMSFLRAYEWNPETASHKLGSLLRNSWFAQALIPRLSFGAMDEDAAITNVLAEACSAGPDYRRELRVLVDFLVVSGLVQRENGQLRLQRQSTAESPESPRAEDRLPEEDEPNGAGPLFPKVHTAYNQPTPGKFSLNIAVEVDMAEFSTWRPERIQAFFRGVAEVLAAKADVEKSGVQN